MPKYRIQIKNYKKVNDFDHVFSTGNLYLIRGANNIGKTSVIKAISAAFNAENLNANPIGAEDGPAVIQCNFTKDGISYSLKYTMENKNGKIVDSILLISDDNKKINNKTEIRNILSFNDFSVDQFFAYGLTAEGRRKQAEIIKRLLPEEVKFDLDVIEAQVNPKNGTVYKERALLSERKKTIDTLINRNNFSPEQQDEINALKNEATKRDKYLEELKEFGEVENILSEIEEIEKVISEIDEETQSINEKRDRQILSIQEEI